MSNVTVIVTSCGRLDLLKQTLDSFFRINKYPLDNVIIRDDSGDRMDSMKVSRIHYGCQVINDGKRLGLSTSLDKLLERVKTEYVFHTEDDWMYYQNSNFIAQSIAVLEADPTIHQVWIRDHTDHQHPLGKEIEIGGVKVHEVSRNYLGVWNGFSFNPTVRRMADIKKMFPKGFSEFGEESECAKHVEKFNYKAVTLAESVVHHIGWSRHVKNFIP